MAHREDATYLQSEILNRGQQIFDLMAGDDTSIFNKDWWYGRIMDWSMKNENFKVQMFRFVDVLPYLSSSDDISRHLKEYFMADNQEIPSILGWGLGLGTLAPGILAYSIKKNVTQMARMFITGATAQDAIKTLKKMRDEKRAFTVDLLGEAVVSEAEAWEHQKQYMEIIETLAQEAKAWPDVPLIDTNHEGALSKVNVSVKVSSLYSQFDPIDPLNSIALAKEKLRPLLRRAKELGVFINLDMESYFHKNITIALFKNLLEEPEFKDHDNVGIVIQAYLKDSEEDLRGLVQWAKSRKGKITIRLVKGAYWDFETVLAKQRGWPIPVFTDKKQTDANYETLSLILLENDRYLRAAFGSHNIRSIAHALVHAERLGVDSRSFEVQMLYGMGDPIKKSLVKMGIRVREYAPVGELIPGMAYLVRRLLENTSNESFLRAKFSTNLTPEELLKDPAERNGSGSKQTASANGASVFVNEPPVDFNQESSRQKMTDALNKVKKQLGGYHPLVIGKKNVKTPREIISTYPADPNVVVGKLAAATETEADQAVSVAREAQKLWAQESVEERAKRVDVIADIMVQRKYELMAWQVFEVGKTWREADGEVAEAIDFCRYYARDMRRLSRPQQCSFVPGEDSVYVYQPRGVGVVIAPWNFPFAILTGMAMAAVVSGNAVIMKPAEQSSVIASLLMQIAQEAGLPPGVLNFLPGYGEEVGEYLVNHHSIDFIVFTGSRQVGLDIIKKAATTTSGQKGVKKVVAEMGGKNAIIVDSDADMDEAVLGCIHSAFGFQGQKCSAASRIIVLENNYEKFVSRLVEAARSLSVGPSHLASTSIGPVVSQEAQMRILSMIEIGKQESKLAYQGDAPSTGYYVPPTIFIDVPQAARIAQEEIFGPVTAVIKAKDFSHALEIANGTEYALTGGLYSRSPANIERAKKEFEVGNLYINRGITGAMVGRHPFGGFKMSGVGSKAGGPDYLLQFTEPRTLTENTMRRGFAPAAQPQETTKSTVTH